MSIDAPIGKQDRRGTPDRPPIARQRHRHDLHALRRAPVLHLRRLPRRGRPADRHQTRADRGIRRRGLVEGDPGARRRGADRGSRRDQRDECDGRRPAEPVAAARARRPGARAALGPGVAAGNRPCAVRRAADPVRRHRAVGGCGRRADRRRAAGGDGRRQERRRASRSSTSRWITSSARLTTPGDPGALAARPDAGSARRRCARRCGGSARRRAAAGDHGGHQRVVGPRRRRRCCRWPKRCVFRC